jgi:hypothetical protein
MFDLIILLSKEGGIDATDGPSFFGQLVQMGHHF